MMEDAITTIDLQQYGLTRDEYERIKGHLGREPNLLELGMFSVMWSEHCSYKSSKVHLKKFPSTGKCVIQGPGENAGVVDIGEGWVAVFKWRVTIILLLSTLIKEQQQGSVVF